MDFPVLNNGLPAFGAVKKHSKHFHLAREFTVKLLEQQLPLVEYQREVQSR
jgi:hypothetical protein